VEYRPGYGPDDYYDCRHQKGCWSTSLIGDRRRQICKSHEIRKPQAEFRFHGMWLVPATLPDYWALKPLLKLIDIALTRASTVMPWSPGIKRN
jgi:hypothetical protein